MASAIIHLAVAKELRKYLDITNEKDYYLGSIAPDCAKHVGADRNKSHFIINSPEDIPNIDIFTKKYPNFKMNSFDLGYFIHLYTDKLWFGTFLEKLIPNDIVTLLDGTNIVTTSEEQQQMIYSDYVNLNIAVVEEYNMDLSLFYEDFQMPKTIITEIPTEKLDIFINKMGLIIENSSPHKPYLFDLKLTTEFINYTKEKTLEILKKY